MIGFLVAGFLATVAGPLAAADSGVYKDWIVHTYREANSKVCLIYSTPKKAEGKYTRRGAIYAIVGHRPGEKITNQVQLEAGYTYQKDSEVTVEIGDKKFTLFSENDSAWVDSRKVEGALVKAMKSGHRMIVRGVSSRGTKTTDTYSLAGFTAAHNAIGKACGVK